MRAGFDPLFCTRRAPAGAQILHVKFHVRLLALFIALATAAAQAATPYQAQPPKAPQSLPAKAPQASPAGRAPVDVDVDKLQPYNLPTASRERMHQCGDEWRKMKMEGKSGGLIWRNFAEKCLTR